MSVLSAIPTTVPVEDIHGVDVACPPLILVLVVLIVGYGGRDDFGRNLLLPALLAVLLQRRQP